MASVGLSEGCALAAGAWLGRMASAREGGKGGHGRNGGAGPKGNPRARTRGDRGRAWVRSWVAREGAEEKERRWPTPRAIPPCLQRLPPRELAATLAAGLQLSSSTPSPPSTPKPGPLPGSHLSRSLSRRTRAFRPRKSRAPRDPKARFRAGPRIRRRSRALPRGRRAETQPKNERRRRHCFIMLPSWLGPIPFFGWDLGSACPSACHRGCRSLPRPRLRQDRCSSLGRLCNFRPPPRLAAAVPDAPTLPSVGASTPQPVTRLAPDGEHTQITYPCASCSPCAAPTRGPPDRSRLQTRAAGLNIYSK